ncbi:MAG: NUDIX domain-containing protein [Bacteroidota bacterium]
MSYFNVRVYGLLINTRNEVLVSDEREYGMEFTKFPGGGLELGEGLIEALQREFMEECNAEVEIIAHFYTTDFYEQSSFNDSQLISVYYLIKEVKPLDLNFKTTVFDFEEGINQSFRWINIDELVEADVTFKTDKTVVGLLKTIKE